MENVSERYRRLAAVVADRIGQVPDDRWDAPSPCQDWTVRDLVGHLVDIHGRFQSLVGRTVVDHPDPAQDALGAFTAVRDQMQADLEDPDKLAEEYDGRLGRSTWGSAVDGFVNFDLVVHGWDLARATGQDETIDPDDVARLTPVVEKMAPVMRDNGAIGDPVETGPDADPQTQPLAALGRKV